MFFFFDIIFVVEGIQLYVCKEELVDNFLVFKWMFELDFKEKYQIEIFLFEKKCEDVEIFLCIFYYFDILCLILSKCFFFIKCKCLIFILIKIVKYFYRVYISEIEFVKE